MKVQFQTVLYHNAPDALKASLESIATARHLALEKGMDVEVTLAWGDSTEPPLFSPDTLAPLQEAFADDVLLTYAAFHMNTGTSLGHNRLAENTDADFLVLMNPDILLAPNFLVRMLPAFKDPQVGMVEARQVPIEHPKVYDTATGEVTWTSGACTMVRTSCFAGLHGYDADSFFMYFDDVDLSWRARLEGWKLLYDPLTAVYHAKALDEKGQLTVSTADRVYSPEAIMILLYKYNWMDALEETMQGHLRSPRKTDREAVERFLRRKEEGRLPKQIDPDHRVSCYIQKDPRMNRYDTKVE